ncbi:hypothetical protein [Lewinella cohaerens]|uniref:hypothetical protein n=1 Tax=Lewinella cohaerens TaxID=70995 RepID=UPI00036B96AC|nr:hypothetical protein [Lewinella cohaerens]
MEAMYRLIVLFLVVLPAQLSAQYEHTNQLDPDLLLALFSHEDVRKLMLDDNVFVLLEEGHCEDGRCDFIRTLDLPFDLRIYDFMETFMRNINTFLRIDKIVINDVSQEIYYTYQLQHQVGSGVVSVFKN